MSMHKQWLGGGGVSLSRSETERRGSHMFVLLLLVRDSVTLYKSVTI